MPKLLQLFFRLILFVKGCKNAHIFQLQIVEERVLVLIAAVFPFGRGLPFNTKIFIGLSSLLQREGRSYIAATKSFLPAGQIVNVTQPGIAPGIGNIEDYDLIAVIQHNITRMGCCLAVAGRETRSQRTHLFKTGIVAHLNSNRSLPHHFYQSIYRCIAFLVYPEVRIKLASNAPG